MSVSLHSTAGVMPERIEKRSTDSILIMHVNGGSGGGGVMLIWVIEHNTATHHIKWST